MTNNTTSPDKLGTHGTKKSSSPKEHASQYDDCKYIDCGQLWALQISQAILTQGAKELNCRKVGCPSVFSNTCFAVTFLFRNATGTEYRQLQGLAETIVEKGDASTYLTFQKRMTRLDCTFTENGRRQHGCRMVLRGQHQD